MMDNHPECIECKKSIEIGSKLCTDCGSYQDFRRHIKTWTPLFGFALAFFAFIASIWPALRTSMFPSSPNISGHIRSIDGRRLTVQLSNIGERRILVDPILRCVWASRIDESIVDFETPFELRYYSFEAVIDNPLSIEGLGGAVSAVFEISDQSGESWLENEVEFAQPDDARVSNITRSFSAGHRATWFGVESGVRVPSFHVVDPEGLISIQKIEEVSTFCQVSGSDPLTGQTAALGFAIWPYNSNSLQGGTASMLYSVLGSLRYVRGDGMNETDPEICSGIFAPRYCLNRD